MILTQLFKHSVQIPIIRNIRAGLKMMLDSSVLINGFSFQSPDIFGSEFFKVFMIIQSRVIMVLTKLSLSSDGSILGPIFETLLRIMFYHALPVLGQTFDNINIKAYSDNSQFLSALGAL